MKDNSYTQQQMADLVDIQGTHLSNLLNNTGDRPLTGYYVQKFIVRGVFKVDDIYDGKATEQKELDFWRVTRVMEDTALMFKIADLKEQGIDVEGMLDAIE